MHYLWNGNDFECVISFKFIHFHKKFVALKIRYISRIFTKWIGLGDFLRITRTCFLQIQIHACHTPFSHIPRSISFCSKIVYLLLFIKGHDVSDWIILKINMQINSLSLQSYTNTGVCEATRIKNFWRGIKMSYPFRFNTTLRYYF